MENINGKEQEIKYEVFPDGICAISFSCFYEDKDEVLYIPIEELKDKIEYLYKEYKNYLRKKEYEDLLFHKSEFVNL